VRCLDAAGKYTDQTWVVKLTDSPERPVYTGPTSATIRENTAVGTELIRATCSDQDPGDVLTFSFKQESTTFSLNPQSGVVTVAKVPNYEQAMYYSLGITCTDRFGLSASGTVAVTVTDVNEPPSITTSALSLPEDSAAGANIGGPIAISDEDVGQSHTLSIVSGSS